MWEDIFWHIILISSCLADSAVANLFFGILYAFVKMSKGMYKVLEWRLNLHSGASSGYEMLETVSLQQRL